jgi:hypothetical protein
MRRRRKEEDMKSMTGREEEGIIEELEVGERQRAGGEGGQD